MDEEKEKRPVRPLSEKRIRNMARYWAFIGKPNGFRTRCKNICIALNSDYAPWEPMVEKYLKEFMDFVSAMEKANPDKEGKRG